MITITSLVSYLPSTSMNFVFEHTDSDNINNQELFHLLITIRPYVK